jgi:hypothetical protein
MAVSVQLTARGSTEPLIAYQSQENCMKLVKTSAIVLAMSAMLAGPVLAQGTSSDTQIRGGAQGKGMQGGVSGSGDEDFHAQPGAPGMKSGAKAGAKGTVGSARGAPSGAAAPADDAPTGKRY